MTFMQGLRAVLFITPAVVVGPAYPSGPSVPTSTPAGGACAELRDRLTTSEHVLTERGAALQERLDAVAAALQELDAQRDAAPAAESADRKETLIGEQSALQNERKFLESAVTAWKAALDACESTARFREDLDRFRTGKPGLEVDFVPGDVGAIQAQLDQVRSARAVLEVHTAVRAQRLAELAELIEKADQPARRLLEAERAALEAKSESARHKLTARDAERALLDVKLTAAREMVGEASATQPETPTSAPAADEADALNKQRLAEQLDAQARDGLAFAQSRLKDIETTLERASAEGLDAARLEDDREYWKRVEAYEQCRLRQAELTTRAGQQKETLAQLRQRIDETRRTLEQLRAQRSEMTPQERRQGADEYTKRAGDAEAEAATLGERATAEENEIEPLQQLLPSLDATQQALDERLRKAEAAGFEEYQRIATHFDRMRRQLDVERQQIDLMIAVAENVAYGKMRQATQTRELAALYTQCAEVLVPPEPSFWERQRRIVNSILIVAAVVGISYGVKLAVWLIQWVLAHVKAIVGGRRLSVKRIGTLVSFAGSIVKLFACVFGTLLVFREFGIDPAKSAGAIGLIGLIMAGMFQQIVVDFVKGLDIIAGRHYDVGDFVEVDGKTGHVVDFSVKHTRIRTPSGQEFNIPNSRCVPSRRFPDGYVDNYVDITLKSSADEDRAKAAIDAVCPNLNQRIEPLRNEPALASRFSAPHDRAVLRYRVSVLPGCAWVVSDYFIPAVTEALAEAGVEIAGQPTSIFINRVETFRKLFSRRLTEEEIVGEVSRDASGLPEAS